MKHNGAQFSLGFTRASGKRIFLECLLVILFLGTHNIAFSQEWIGNIDQLDIDEPSGIVFHPERETLFVVGDEGEVCEIKRNGTLVKHKRIRAADLEGITCDSSTGLLYIAVEGEEKIIEIDPEDFRVQREFSLNRVFRGARVLKAGGQGIEAITFVPDRGHPEGGTFYVTNQGFDLADAEDPSAIFELEVPLKSGSGEENIATIVRYFSLGVIDLSGLYHDEMSGHLYVASDAMNRVFEITRQGDIVQSYDLPGVDQEGIAIDSEGFLYVAQDSGGIIKVKWNKKRK